MNSFGWCTVESDPAVFTEMLENFGVSGVVVNEVVSLEEGILKNFGKIFGVILLFKWKPHANQQLSTWDNFESNSLYFAKQVVNNACATQSILNTILNFPNEIELGKELSNFLEFTSGLDPEMRGEMVGQSEVIRTVHNSFARPATFAFEDIKGKEDDDVYHFTSFIFKNGGIYELDGLKPGPLKICAATPDSWQSQMIHTINGRMQEISANDRNGAGQGISFSLLVVNEDKIPILQKRIDLAMSEEKPCDDLIAELEETMAERERGKQENVRRRHNYIPAVVELLRALADKGKLKGCLEATVKHAQEQSRRSGKKKHVEEF
eukprot:Tbor_TRINITY_DN3951_c0_g1::TRINITY_DN3951_c0_g1_i1::g.715::m.715/K05610/UCHL5, UCH37; ubiquitin carboxyl-terminal hydrolase L5